MNSRHTYFQLYYRNFPTTPSDFYKHYYSTTVKQAALDTIDMTQKYIAQETFIESHPLIKKIRMVKVFKISHFRQVLNFVQLSNPRGHLLGTFLSVSRHSTFFELILLIFYFYYIILTVLVICYTGTGSSNLNKNEFETHLPSVVLSKFSDNSF